jgi:ribosomal protein L7Ae-like RNA K-turn-binding protein
VLQAVRQKVFTRSLKRETQADETLADLVGDLLLARVIQKLAMANKAGLVVSGAAKVERAIERGRAFAVLHACDAAKDGMRKIDQKLAHFLADTGVAESERAGRVVGFLTSAELSLAIGRPNVVHAALSSGGASRSFLAEAERLLGYRLGVTANTKARGQTAGTERA